MESCSSEKAKPPSSRKYDESYISHGFSWNVNVDDPHPACFICGIEKLSEPLFPSKLCNHLRRKLSHLEDKSKIYFMRMSEQLGNCS